MKEASSLGNYLIWLARTNSKKTQSPTMTVFHKEKLFIEEWEKGKCVEEFDCQENLRK